VASVAVTGSLLAACSSSTPAPFASEPPLRGSVVAAGVLAEDPAFDVTSARRARYVPCQGLSGCARTSPASGSYYPGVILPTDVDGQVHYSQEFVLYLVGATFDQATLDGSTVHIRLETRPKGFQMVKLDGQQVLAIPGLVFSFENPSGHVICTSGWQGCG